MKLLFSVIFLTLFGVGLVIGASYSSQFEAIAEHFKKFGFAYMLTFGVAALLTAIGLIGNAITKRKIEKLKLQQLQQAVKKVDNNINTARFEELSNNKEIK